MKIAVTPSCSRQRGFTLIELLVVIGIIAVVTTIIGLGLSEGTESASLAAAEGIMVSQFAAARAQAALRGETAAVVVVDDVTAPERSRRVVGVAVNDEGLWRLISDPVLLTGGVGVADPRVGRSLWTSSLAVALDPGDATTNCLAIEIAANGSLVNPGGGEVWLFPGQLSPAGWQPSLEAEPRGLRVSRYGAMQSIEGSLTTDE